MANPPRHERHPQLLVYAILGLVVLLGPLNFVLYKMMFSSFGDAQAFYVSQAVNLLYVVYGGAALATASLRPNFAISRPRRPHPPRRFPLLCPRVWDRKYFIMGLLDCFGTFFTALGAVHTPGPIQTLLNQALIPCTMAASAACLGRRFTPPQLAGASAILVGAAIAVYPAFTTTEPESADTGNRWYANIIYISSNVPMALSAVYKEYAFKNQRVHVLYLTQCVSIWQLFLGFALAPLQLFPGLSGSTSWSNLSAPVGALHRLAEDFGDGLQCSIAPFAPSVGVSGTRRCGWWPAGVLVLAYCAVNFVFNTLGLVLTKKASATVNAISYALILPLTSFAFSFGFLGPFREPVTLFTLAGLLVAVLGFCSYEYGHQERRRQLSSQAESSRLVPEPSASASTAPQADGGVSLDGHWVVDEEGERYVVPDAFHERVVGVRHAITGALPLMPPLAASRRTGGRESDGPA